MNICDVVNLGFSGRVCYGVSYKPEERGCSLKEKGGLGNWEGVGWGVSALLVD